MLWCLEKFDYIISIFMVTIIDAILILIRSRRRHLSLLTGRVYAKTRIVKGFRKQLIF